MIHILGHMMVLFLIFWYFSIVTVPVNNLTNIAKYVLLSTSIPAFVIFSLFDHGHCNRCKMISHFGFDLHFSYD